MVMAWLFETLAGAVGHDSAIVVAVVVAHGRPALGIRPTLSTAMSYVWNTFDMLANQVGREFAVRSAIGFFSELL